MRLISYGQPGRERPGILLDQAVVPLEELDPVSTSVRVALAENRLPLIRTKLASWTGKTLPLSMLRLGPPVPDARKIICIGLNYRGHAIEQKKPWPKQPLLFAKTCNTLNGPVEDVVVPDGCRGDYEVELAVVIGRRTHQVEAAEALASIGGYMVANDISARRWQHEDGQWFRAKSCDGFFPCGPCLVTPDEVPDPAQLRLTTTIGGEVLQEALLSDLIHPLEQLIAYISRTITLEAGDIISTGTPAGVGAFRTPPRALADGEVVECAITGLGVLRNRITILPRSRGMKRILVFFGLLLTAAGLLIVAPLALARWHHVATRAEIKDVFLQPVGDQQARLQVALEFTVAEDGKKVSYSSFGNNLADDRLRPIADPVLPLADAQAYAHQLLGDDPNLRPTCTVFYPPAEPADARMISNVIGGPSHVYEFGLGMLACGIMCMMLARRAQERAMIPTVPHGRRLPCWSLVTLLAPLAPLAVLTVAMSPAGAADQAPVGDPALTTPAATTPAATPAVAPPPSLPLGTVEISGTWNSQPFWARLLPPDAHFANHRELQLSWVPPAPEAIDGVHLVDCPFILLDDQARVIAWNGRDGMSQVQPNGVDGYRVQRELSRGSGVDAAPVAATRLIGGGRGWDLHLAPLLLALTWHAGGHAQVHLIDLFGSRAAEALGVRWDLAHVMIAGVAYVADADHDGHLARLASPGGASLFEVTSYHSEGQP